MGTKKKEDKINQQIHYALTAIYERKFSISNPPNHELYLNENQEIVVETNINYKWNFEEDLFSIIVLVDYTTDFKDETLYILNFENEVIFKILDLKSWYLNERKAFTFPIHFVEMITSLSVGLVRGIIFEKSKGFFASKSILPLLDVKTMLEEANEKAKILVV